MKDALKPYPAYKDSSVPWLGDTPEHWGVRRIKTLFREKDLRSGDGQGTLLSLTRTRGIIPQSEASKRIASVDDLSKYKICQPSDLVMNRMQAWSGMFAVSALNGLISPDYSIFKPIVISKIEFFEYLFKTPVLVNLFAQNSKGIGSGFNRLYTPDFGAIPIAIPPLPEQTAIVRYLDYIDRRIRCFINAKKKLIGLLNEQKQAIIQHALTRGLDPNVRLKPSGVEWLGGIPEHWEMRRLRFLANISTGGKDTVNREDGGLYPFFVRSQTVERINSFSFDGEAVLTAGDGAGVAKVFHYVNGKFDYHQRVYKFSSFLGVKGKFFFYYLKTNLRFEALDASAKSTVDSLRLPMLQNLAVALPPIDEQRAIVEWIERKSMHFDAAIERAQREMALLYEYRTRLIADVVTGKLDVREAVASLPDDTEEPEDIGRLVDSDEVIEDTDLEPVLAEADDGD